MYHLRIFLAIELLNLDFINIILKVKNIILISHDTILTTAILLD